MSELKCYECIGHCNKKGYPSVRKILRTLFLDKNQSERLRELSEKTKVPQSVYIREGIDLVLNKYKRKFKMKK